MVPVRQGCDLRKRVEPPLGIEPTTFSLRGAFAVFAGDSQRLWATDLAGHFAWNTAGQLPERGQHGDSARR